MIDYSQLELCLLAYGAVDAARGEDIYARVAGKMYNVVLDKVTPAMRRAAKAVTFSRIYRSRNHERPTESN